MKKEWVRENFPECCQVADEYRAVFGEGTKLVYAEEGGKSIGKRTDTSNAVIAADIVRADFFCIKPKKRGR